MTDLFRVVAARVEDPGERGFVNPPRLQVQFDFSDDPDWDPVAKYWYVPRERFVYEARSAGKSRKGIEQTAYWAEHRGMVRFYLHDPGYEQGFGGRTYDLTLTDGSTVSIKGPWSSSPAAMASFGFPPSLDFSYCRDAETMVRGHTFMAGSCTPELAREAVDLIEGWELIEGQAPKPWSVSAGSDQSLIIEHGAAPDPDAVMVPAYALRRAT